MSTTPAESKTGSFGCSSPPAPSTPTLAGLGTLARGDLVFAMRSDQTNSHAVRQFAKTLKNGLRIHGLKCVGMTQVQ